MTVPGMSLTQYSLTGQNANGLNVVQNGSFESLGGANWSFNDNSGSHSLVTLNSYDGNNAYTFDNGSCATQTVSLTGGATYNLSAYSQVTAEGGTLSLTGSGSPLVSVPLTGSTYTLDSQSVAIPSGVTSATLSVCGPAAGSAIVDNVVLSTVAH